MATQHSQTAAESQTTAGPRIAPPGDSALYNDNVHAGGVSSTLQRDFDAKNALGYMLDGPPDTTYRVAAATGNRYMALPPAAECAAAVGGKRYSANDFRIPHLCGGAQPHSALPGNGKTPGLQLWDNPDGATGVKCWYGCEARDAYAAVRLAVLGNAGADVGAGIAARPVARPAARPVAPDLPPVLATVKTLKDNFRWRNSPPPPEIPLYPGTGWPLLAALDVSVTDQLKGISARYTAWTKVILADGMPNYFHRMFPNGPKGFWQRRPEGAPPRTVKGLTPIPWLTPAGDDVGDDYVATLITEGDKDGLAAAIALAASGWRILSPPGATAMGDMALDLLLDGKPVWIAADFDKPGLQAADKLKRRQIDAGKPTRLTGVIPPGAIISAGRSYNPDIDVKGIGLADIPPESTRAIAAAALAGELDGHFSERFHNVVKGDSPPPVSPDELLGNLSENPAPGPAPGKVYLTLPNRYKAPYRCLNLRRAARGKDSKDDECRFLMPCDECPPCLHWHWHCKAMLYGAGIGPDSLQSVVTYPYGGDPDKARRFVKSIVQVAKYRNGNATPDYKAIANYLLADGRQSGAVKVIFRRELPADVEPYVRDELAKFTGATLANRRIGQDDFLALLPPDKRQHTSLDGTEFADGNPRKPLHTLSGSRNWPAEFVESPPVYAYSGFVIEELDKPAGPEEANRHTERFLERRLLGPELHAFLEAEDRIDLCHSAPPLEITRSLEVWHESGGPKSERNAILAEFREATGYNGPDALILDSVKGGKRQCHKLIQHWLAGLPLGEITRPPARPPGYAYPAARRDAPDWRICAGCGKSLRPVDLAGNAGKCYACILDAIANAAP